MEIVYSSDFSLINLKVSRLARVATEELTILSFINHSWTQIETALVTINFIPSKKRVIILQDAFFLTSSKVKLHDSFNKKRFWNLIDRLDPSLTLILTVVSSKISANWPKNIKPVIHEQKALSRSKLRTYLDKKIKPNLELEALNYFLDNFHQIELHQIRNEIEKINHLFQANQKVTLKQLRDTIITPINFDIFKMGSSFVNGNLNQFLQLWNDGLGQEANIQQLIGLLTKQLITLHWYFQYRALNLTDLEIAERLAINPYYLKRLVATNQQQVKQINDRIIYIYNLNKKLLSGRIDKKIIPEYLFLKMFPQFNERKENGTK